MDWIKRLNQAIDFIEENLDGELDYEEVAGIAGCPSYYFQQMFLYMTDMTLREYIRRRRLSLSAVELQKGNGNVTDIAMKYGYESPTAFTRSFKNFHGITPSAVKTEPVSFQAYPPISFSMAIHGGVPLQLRIEEKRSVPHTGTVLSPVERTDREFSKDTSGMGCRTGRRNTCQINLHGRGKAGGTARCQYPSYGRLEISDCCPFRSEAGGTQTTDLFEILCQRVLAGCVFMREAPTIYLFILRAFFEENPEIREELQNHYKTAYLYGISGKGLPEKSWTMEKGVPERKESLRWQFQI